MCVLLAFEETSHLFAGQKFFFFSERKNGFIVTRSLTINLESTSTKLLANKQQ
jgi:hypothetical protein